MTDLREETRHVHRILYTRHWQAGRLKEARRIDEGWRGLEKRWAAEDGRRQA